MCWKTCPNLLLGQAVEAVRYWNNTLSIFQAFVHGHELIFEQPLFAYTNAM